MAAAGEFPTTETLLLAVLTLLADERQGRAGDGDVKTELLLHRVGLHPTVIATVMGKQPDAVRKTISRAGSKSDG